LNVAVSDRIGFGASFQEDEPDEPKTKKVKKTVNDWELINDAKALWTRNPADITDDEYKSFYQSLTKDFGEPLTHTHFRHGRGRWLR